VAVSEIVARRAARPVREYPLVGLLAAAGAGIEIDHRLGIHPVVWGLLLAVGLATWWWLWRARRDRAAAWLVLVVIGALGGAWHHDRWFLFRADELARFAGGEPTSVCLSAKALDVPSYRPAARPSPLSTMARGPTSRLPIHACAVRSGAGWRPVSGDVMLTVRGRLPWLGRGDQLRVVGDLYRATAPRNPGVPDFAAFGRGRRQLCLLICRHAASVRVARRGWRLNPLRWPGAVRYWSLDILHRYVGPRQAPLAAALILGERRALDDDTVATFFTSGTLHLLAISGLHVGILASLSWLLLRLQGWPRPLLLVITAGLVIGYAAVTGMRTPVLRATLLVLAYCLARASGQRGTAWNLLAAAGLFTLAVRPTALRAPGAQLSFLAVATIVRAWPRLRTKDNLDPLDRLIARTRPLAVRIGRAAIARGGRVLALSAVVWLVSAPLVAARFHLLAPTAILLNLILWLPVVVAMFAGILTLVAGLVAAPLAPAFGTVCAGALQVTHQLATHATTWPGGHWWLAGPPGWWLWAFYVGLAACTTIRPPALRRWRWHLLVIWLCVGLASGSVYQRMWHAFAGRPLRITFASVGHGVCVLLELPDGRNVVYDAGRMGSRDAAAAPVCGLLWSRHVCHIDALVLSHADVDHFNAVPVLLERFSLGGVYVSPVMFRRRTPAVALLHGAIRKTHVPILVVHETDRLAVGSDIVLEVLHPPLAGCGSSDNENSVVLLLQYGAYRVLLTGDLERAGLDELLAEDECHCDVLLAPHHGSANSDPSRVTAWATPTFVVISDASHRAGTPRSRNSYHDASRVVHTGYQGACQFVIQGRQLQARLWRSRWTRIECAPTAGPERAARE